MIFLLGFMEILHYPSVIKALSPVYAFRLLTDYPQGFWLLGAVFLCTTGAEALFSDLGHCGRKNIRITWFYVKISLIANYLGQAAWIMHQGDPFLNGRNPFFEMMPQWFLLIGIVIATLATIIASQALISGSYTLISEAMNLNFWPRVKVKQPTELKGQIYIPSVNTILWVGSILTILHFQNSAHMVAAYGFLISMAMMMTTFLLAYYLIYVRKWNSILIIAIILMFGIIESSFLISNVAKIKQMWMFLCFELIIFSTMYIWYYARKIKNKFTRFIEIGKYTPLIQELSSDDSIPKFATHLIYLTKANNRHEIEQKIMDSIFARNPKRADVYWFLHINRVEDPYTLTYDVSELIDDKLIKININIGFRIQPRTELYFKKIVQELVARKELNLHIRPDGSTKYNSEPNFKFIVIEKYLSVENEFSLREGVLLHSYYYIRKFGQNDEKAYGLDKSDVKVEYIPFVLQPATKIDLTRIEKNGLGGIQQS